MRVSLARITVLIAALVLESAALAPRTKAGDSSGRRRLQRCRDLGGGSMVIHTK